MNDLKGWVKKIKLSTKESQLLNKKHIDDFKETHFSNTEKYILKKKFFNRLLNNISNKDYNLYFNKSATYFIDALFKKYCNDNTLIICSDSEHDNVNLILKKYKNVVKINKFDLSVLNTVDFNKYSNVFVYFIGTQISSGIVTPQSLFLDLKDILNKYKVNNIFVLDAVQEFFILPRDYHIFDFIIGTFHSLIIDFNLGFLLSKYKVFEEVFYEKLVDFIPSLDIFLKRRYLLFELKHILLQRYIVLLKYRVFEFNNFTSPNIFSIKIHKKLFNKNDYDLLNKYDIRIEGLENDIQFIRIRMQHYIKNPMNILKGLEYLNFILREKYGYEI